MLKLFYASGTSAMAPHILLTDAGLNFELEKVNLDQKTWRGGDYDQINAKSYVPTLQIAPEQYLTECAVILEYIDFQARQNDSILPQNSTKTLFRLFGRVIGYLIRMIANGWCGSELPRD